jgi:hypothetical protein
MIVLHSERFTSGCSRAAVVEEREERENAAGADSMSVARRRGCMWRYSSYPGQQSL